MRVAIVTNNSDNLTTADYKTNRMSSDWTYMQNVNTLIIYVSCLLLFILADIKANLVSDSETRHNTLTSVSSHRTEIHMVNPSPPKPFFSFKTIQ